MSQSVNGDHSSTKGRFVVGVEKPAQRWHIWLIVLAAALTMQSSIAHSQGRAKSCAAFSVVIFDVRLVTMSWNHKFPMLGALGLQQAESFRSNFNGISAGAPGFDLHQQTRYERRLCLKARSSERGRWSSRYRAR